MGRLLSQVEDELELSEAQAQEAAHGATATPTPTAGAHDSTQHYCPPCVREFWLVVSAGNGRPLRRKGGNAKGGKPLAGASHNVRAGPSTRAKVSPSCLLSSWPRRAAARR